MKKTKIATLVSAMTLASSVFAGTMGPAAAEQHALYTSLDAAYTWNSIGNTTINSHWLNTSDEGWGGRIAAGAMHHTASPWSFSAEAGWGYYGQTKASNTALTVNNTVDLYGMDILVGTMYHFDQVDIFGKAGGMIENTRISRQISNIANIEGANYAGSSRIVRTVSNVLPELSVGGIYNFTDHLGISVAYFYAFGENVKMTTNRTTTETPLLLTKTTNATGAPVSLSTILFGLRYNFA
jgi:hypothetical protein